MSLAKAFDLLEAADVWERDGYDDLWAIKYSPAINVLVKAGYKDPDDIIEIVADYYGLDVD